MVGFVGNLRAKLGLDTAEFQAKMRASQQEARGFSASIGQNLRALSSSALGQAAAVAAGVASAAQIRSVVRDIAAIGDEARRSGLPVEEFQQWSYVARQNRVQIDALVDGFKELSLRSDEFIATGGGPAAEAFQRLGFNARDLATSLRDPSDLMLEIFDRLRNLDNAARIRVLDEVLGGTGGERFVQLIEQGGASLRRTMADARAAGAVWSSEMINHAAEIDQRFDRLSTQIGYYGQRALVGWAMIFDAAIEAVAPGTDEVTQATRDLDAEYSTLAAQIQGLSYEMQGLADAAEDAGDPAFARAFQSIADALELVSDEFTAGRISGDHMRSAVSQLLSTSNLALDSVRSIDDVSLDNAGRTVEGLRGFLANLATQALETARVVAAATITPARQVESFWDTEESRFSLNQLAPETSPAPRSAPRNIDFGLPPVTTRGGGGGASEGYAGAVADIRARTEALLAEATALSEVAASGLEYGQATEYARVRAEALAALHEEGRAVTPALAAEIDTLARAYASAGNNVETLRDQLQRAREDGQRGAEALANIFGAALQGGDAARNAVARLIAEIARMQALRGFQALASGGGGAGRFFGLLGSLIGKNARGTESWRGGLTWVGEEGAELLDLPAGARITPALESAKLMREGVGGQMGVHVTVSVDENGNLQAAARKVARAEIRAAKPQFLEESVAATRASYTEFR